MFLHKKRMAHTKRVTIDFPENLYRTLKAFTAFNDSSIKSFVLNAISKDLLDRKIKIANEQTLQTFKDTDEGKNIESVNNFNELLSAIQEEHNS